MTRPLIAITAYPRVVDIVPIPTLLQTANRFYLEAVLRAGGIPLILPVMDPFLAPAALAPFAGVVLPGGGDVDPASYRETAEPETGLIDPDRDTWDLACARAALEADLPLLAICRGAQVLNVALGGSLIQDVPTATGVNHSWSSRYDEQVHRVAIAPSSRLAGLLGVDEVGTNSLHHQAVGRPGAGVVPVAWAPDGTVEAFEVDGRPLVTAVQWHPELMAADPVQQLLFSALVDAATRRVV